MSLASTHRVSRVCMMLGWLALLAACGPATSTSAPDTAVAPAAVSVSESQATATFTAPSATATLSEQTATPQPAASPTAEPPTIPSTASHTPTFQPPSPTLSPTPEPPATTLATETTVARSPTPSEPPAAFPPSIALEPALSGFRLPTYVTQPAGDPAEVARLFVVEKAGRILLVEDGSVQPTPFLDISDRVGSQASEQGLLGLAFPPDYASTGFFYVDYTDLNGDTVIARYRLLDEDGRQGDPSSEQKLLQIDQPAGNHNGGQLEFGPDGYLYIGMGDGGAAGDPWGNAQNPGALLGKLLRIDVSEGEAYSVPADNPFLGQAGAQPEVWALGLRNPWRFSFDRATGDLYIADVGQNQYEEVDFQPAASAGGENYGWDIMEGNHCFEPQSGCDSQGLVPPVAEYDHGQGCSITGGYVYRGTRYPQMVGVYFFADYCSGNMWALRQQESGEWETALLMDVDLTISSFGEDAAEELYVVGYRDGVIYRLIATP